MSKFNLRNVNKKVFIIAVLIIAALLIVLFVDSKRSKKTKEKSQITQEGTDLLQEQEKVVKSDKVIATSFYMQDL